MAKPKAFDLKRCVVPLLAALLLINPQLVFCRSEGALRYLMSQNTEKQLNSTLSDVDICKLLKTEFDYTCKPEKDITAECNAFNKIIQMHTNYYLSAWQIVETSAISQTPSCILANKVKTALLDAVSDFFQVRYDCTKVYREGFFLLWKPVNVSGSYSLWIRPDNSGRDDINAVFSYTDPDRRKSECFMLIKMVYLMPGVNNSFSFTIQCNDTFIVVAHLRFDIPGTFINRHSNKIFSYFNPKKLDEFGEFKASTDVDQNQCLRFVESEPELEVGSWFYSTDFHLLIVLSFLTVAFCGTCCISLQRYNSVGVVIVTA